MKILKFDFHHLVIFGNKNQPRPKNFRTRDTGIINLNCLKHLHIINHIFLKSVTKHVHTVLTHNNVKYSLLSITGFRFTILTIKQTGLPCASTKHIIDELQVTTLTAMCYRKIRKCTCSYLKLFILIIQKLANKFQVHKALILYTQTS